MQISRLFPQILTSHARPIGSTIRLSDVNHPSCSLPSNKFAQSATSGRRPSHRSSPAPLSPLPPCFLSLVFSTVLGSANGKGKGRCSQDRTAGGLYLAPPPIWLGMDTPACHPPSLLLLSRFVVTAHSISSRYCLRRPTLPLILSIYAQTLCICLYKLTMSNFIYIFIINKTW